MDTTIDYLMWSAIQFIALAAVCFFFWLDRLFMKREKEQGQRTAWYRRPSLVASWIFLVPLLGVEIPKMIVTLVVFHGSVLPDDPDFDYQVFKHSLSFITWISICSYGVTILLIIYLIYLGAAEAFRQLKLQKAGK